MKDIIVETAKKAQFDQGIINALETYDYGPKPQTNPLLNHDDFMRCHEKERFRLCLDAAYLFIIKMKAQKIPDEIFYPTYANFNHHLMKYYKVHQDLGIYQKDMKWLNLLFTEKIFKIHTLRFQIFPMDYVEMERSGHDYLKLPEDQKERFPIDFPMVNVHIETDTDLSPKAVDESFKKANAFFHEFYPEFKYQYFICRTWILHPSLNLLLDRKTNLVHFKERFELIATSQNYVQALERIYGTADLDLIKSMPKEGRLQKQAYKIYPKLGVGIGVIAKEQFND